jgi:hypothetical protein
MQYDNSFAGASAIGHLFAIVIIGAIGGILEYVIYKSQFMFVGLSQDASNTIFYLENGMLVVFLLVLIAIILSHWINEKSAGNMNV